MDMKNRMFLNSYIQANWRLLYKGKHFRHDVNIYFLFSILLLAASMGVVRTDESRRAEIEEFRRMLLSCSGVVLKVTTEEEYNRRQVPAANRNEYTADQKLVCVTSGVSFLGIAIVKKLLLRGYSVRIIVDNEGKNGAVTCIVIN